MSLAVSRRRSRNRWRNRGVTEGETDLALPPGESSLALIGVTSRVAARVALEEARPVDWARRNDNSVLLPRLITVIFCSSTAVTASFIEPVRVTGRPPWERGRIRPPAPLEFGDGTEIARLPGFIVAANP